MLKIQQDQVIRLVAIANDNHQENDEVLLNILDEYFNLMQALADGNRLLLVDGEVVDEVTLTYKVPSPIIIPGE